MKQLDRLHELKEALADAQDVVDAHILSGGRLPNGEVVPFNPRAEVFNNLRDALRILAFSHDGAPEQQAGGNVEALSTAGLALIEEGSEVAQ